MVYQNQGKFKDYVKKYACLTMVAARAREALLGLLSQWILIKEE